MRDCNDGEEEEEEEKEERLSGGVLHVVVATRYICVKSGRGIENWKEEEG